MSSTKVSLNKIVDAIVRQLQEHPEFVPSPKKLEQWLAKAGFSKVDIAAAMRIVEPQIAAAAPKAQRGLGSIRHLSSYESFKLSLEARNALARLEMYEMLEPWERELVLDHAMHQDGVVGLDDLEHILQNTVYLARDIETQQTMDAVFSGITDMLH